MEQLRTLRGLLQEPNKMGDAPPAAPRSQRGKGATVLEETDDEEDEAEPDREEDMDLEEDGPADGKATAGDPMEKALLKLTEIVGTS